MDVYVSGLAKTYCCEIITFIVTHVERINDKHATSFCVRQSIHQPVNTQKAQAKNASTRSGM